MKRTTVMKTYLKPISAVVAAIIVGVALGKWPTIHAQTADFQQGPTAVVVNPGPKEYRVIDITQIPVNVTLTFPRALESGLNQMGGQGWQVVAATGNLLILMR